MGWTTGPKRYQKFPIRLHDYHLDVWELLTGDRTHTVAHFNAQLQEFKLELQRGYKYEEQMNYLRSLKKSDKMEPSQFLLKLRLANRMAIQLLDAPEFEQGLSDLQLRRVFFAAMPSSWQDHFEDANFDVDNTTIEDIKNYMDKQSNKDLFIPKNKDKATTIALSPTLATRTIVEATVPTTEMDNVPTIPHKDKATGLLVATVIAFKTPTRALYQDMEITNGVNAVPTGSMRRVGKTTPAKATKEEDSTAMVPAHRAATIRAKPITSKVMLHCNKQLLRW